MLIHLHSQATTTPKIRAEIQASDEPAWVLAERFGTTEQTVWKWRKRDSVQDRSHTAHRLQTTLTPAQEAVAVSLRKTLLVSLDDLLAVVREFLNPKVSRSGLYRCLRRHGVGNLRDLKVKTVRPKHGGFKAYEPGYIHIDVKYLPHLLVLCLSRLSCDCGATARHVIYDGRWRGSDRSPLGRCGPSLSMVAPVFSADLNGYMGFGLA
jgi:hypothetical protein